MREVHKRRKSNVSNIRQLILNHIYENIKSYIIIVLIFIIGIIIGIIMITLSILYFYKNI